MIKMLYVVCCQSPKINTHNHYSNVLPNHLFIHHIQHLCIYFSRFVCVEVLWPSQPNGVMSSTVSLPNHTFTGQA